MILPEQLDTASVTQSFSTAVLLLFLGAGIYGIVHTPDNRVIIKKAELGPTKMELVKVDLKEPEPPPPPPPEPPPEDTQEPPPTPDTVVIPDKTPPPPSLEPPAPVKVAAPSPNTAFALPVVGVTKTVADPAQASGSAPRGQPKPQVFLPNYGSGPGRQIPPRYPRQAELDRQEGTVLISFLTDQAGNVTRASVRKSSGFPLLDSAALTAVKKWVLPNPRPGQEYETPIDFVMPK